MIARDDALHQDVKDTLHAVREHGVALSLLAHRMTQVERLVYGSAGFVLLAVLGASVSIVVRAPAALDPAPVSAAPRPHPQQQPPPQPSPVQVAGGTGVP